MKSTVKSKSNRRISEADVEKMAELVGTKFMTEKEAASLLGIKPEAWFQFKCRGGKGKSSAKFEDLTLRLKTHKLKTLIDRIEDASDPAKTKRPEWRAASWLAERIKPEALSLQAAHSPFPASASALDTSRLIDAMTRVYASPAVAAIECRTTEEKPEIECRTTGGSQAYAPAPPPRRRV